MSLIVDASVAVKWFSAEDGADRAEALFVAEPDLAAPELILAEVGNAMWKKHRKDGFHRRRSPPRQNACRAFSSGWYRSLTLCRAHRS